jgi:phosphate transport system permease protein
MSSTGVSAGSPRRSRRAIEKAIEYLFLASAALSVLGVLFITVFIILEGLPLFFESTTGHPPPTLWDFLAGSEWFPTGDPPQYGILPFITGSLLVTAGALIVAVPVGIAVGVFIAEIAKGKWQRALRSVTEILAGIPSVVYGFFGVMMIGFFLQNFESPLVNYNAFSASIILAVMTLPTIINITEVSIRSVPRDYVDGSSAIGATHWQTIIRVLIPAARSGIISGVILGMGRAIGETMAVLMVAGNQPTIPTEGMRSRVRTLTMAIVNDMGYAGGSHRVALFATAMVLFIFIMLLFLTTRIITRRSAIQVK